MKEGWKMVKLGDVCEIFGRIGFRGYTTKDIVSSSDEGAISLSPANIQDGKMDYSKCTYISWFKYEESPEIMIFNGDILLVKTGSSYGKSALVEKLPHKATINPQSVVLKNFKINNKFLAYQLRTQRIKDEFDRFVSGTAIPTFSQAKLSEVLICCPPLEEQHRIVSILDAAFEKIDKLKANAEENLKNAKALFQQVLAQELKPKEGWVEKKLGEVSKEIFAGGDAPKNNMSKMATEKYKIPIYANAVEDDGLYGFTDYAKVNEPAITIAARGSGTGYVLRRNIPFLPIVRLIVVLPKDIVDINYIYYALKNMTIRKTGSAIPQLTVPMIREYKINYPNIKEQNRIVQTLDALSEKCRRLETIAQQTIRECDALKQSILRQAFSGEL